MLRLAAIGIVAVFSAAVSAKAVIALGGERPAVSAAAAAPADAAQTLTPVAADAALVKSPDGHYWAEADVNGHAVRFLVDTGASDVALTLDDARRLGFEPKALTYGYQVTTAAGPVRAAKVKLDSVAVSGAQVRDVDALVIEKGLKTSLLGMTYLGRLSRIEATPTSLILRP
jgi:aspartyl protease family protein